MLKVKVDGNGSQSSFVDFFNSVIRGSFNKVDGIQKRLDNISMHLRGMGLHDITIRFDKSVRPETRSMMLITTRSQQVADKVGTMDPITLEGLKDDSFWNFFKVCVFESGSSSNNDPELEHIGRRIVPKLKGSPLAAKTLGRILRMNLQVAHWNDVLESELWELSQEETEILPALRLSYMYLPFHLKRCFSFCAVYPKDDKFQKKRLAEIWVAEGFVEPQGDTPLQDIGCDYFNDLLNRSFFQEVQGEYLMHDLMHDMAQKVSEHECFIVKRKRDFPNIPHNVRHLSILSSVDIDNPNLLSLCHFTKLRTLLCKKPLANKKTPASLMEKWWSELLCVRVIVCVTTNELPAAIGNLKHLRYLQVLRASPFKSLPDELCRLYNLQILCVEKCKLESLPSDFSNLICLQRFESNGFRCNSRSRSFREEEIYYEVSIDGANDEQGQGFSLMKNINKLVELVIYNIDKQSKEHAAEAQLENKKYLEMLKLSWSGLRCNDIEVLRVLQPPTCLKSLTLHRYPGVSLPSWSASSISERINPSEIPEVLVDNTNDNTGIFPSLTELVIDECQNLSCLEHILHPACVPAIKKITIKGCKNLVSVPAERFGDLVCLEELTVQGCPNISSQGLVAPSLKRLVLGRGYDASKDHSCGNLADNVNSSSLTYFFLSSNHLTSIQLQMWNLPALEELKISRC
ncbi:hypothetical protein ACQJBY_066755 [Aegilops geniculata]